MKFMKYEYKVLNFSVGLKSGNSIEKKLQEVCDEYGNAGWDLVNFHSYDMSSKFLLIFKKEKE